MFKEHTEWMEKPCYYVTAVDGITRITLLAGPYRSQDAAAAVFESAQRWAIDCSGDPRADSYTYGVGQAHNGYHLSILGIVDP